VEAVEAGSFRVGRPEDGLRLDEAIARLAGISRARASRAVESGRANVDGRARAKSHRVREGELIEVEPEAPAVAAPPPKVRIAYEDSDLVVVDKPAGVVVHASPGHAGGTLVDGLRKAGVPLSGGADPDRPGIVHRLDKGTSGLLVVTKNETAHRALAGILAEHSMTRTYLALVQGHMRAPEGTVDAPLGRSSTDRRRRAVVAGGRRAVTHYRVIDTFSRVSLLEVTLETGRTHQIRAHLAYLRHPVVGDREYGADPRLAGELGLVRPFLHAWRLSFPHPASGATMLVEAPLPGELEEALSRLSAAQSNKPGAGGAGRA